MIKFPTFDPGTPGTLLDSVNAKLVKQFIECWNSATVVIGNENKVTISENNVVISLNRADLGGGASAMTQAEWEAYLDYLLVHGGATGDRLYDMAFDAAIDTVLAGNVDDYINDLIDAKIAAIPTEDVSTCDPGGTITVLVQP